jgi:hypothetical protein
VTKRDGEREIGAMRGAWLPYAGLALALAVLIGGVTWGFAPPDAARAVWVGTGVAFVAQLVAFALLVHCRGRANLFIAGWLGGMLLRFGALGAVAVWVTRSGALAPPATLLSLVGFLFLLLLLEPLFLRKGLRTT